MGFKTADVKSTIFDSDLGNIIERKTNNKGVHELLKEGLMDGEKGLSFVLTKKHSIYFNNFLRIMHPNF